jgi:uncharacterized repeat protein (TIGR01451 family)
LITPTVAGDNLVFELGTIPGWNYSGYHGSIDVTVHVTDTVEVGAELKNEAVIATRNDINPENNVAQDASTVVDTTRDLYVALNVDQSQPLADSDLDYRIYYRNYGNAALRNVIITATIPANLSYVNTGGSIAPTVIDNQLIWNLCSIPDQATLGAHD